MSLISLTSANGGIRTSKPSAASDGVALRRQSANADGLLDHQMNGVVVKYNATVTAGQTATLSFLKVWVYDGAKWHPFGPAPVGGADADRGKLNNAVAFGEDGDDQINYCDVLNGLRPFTRFCLEEGTKGGSGYASTGELRPAGGG